MRGDNALSISAALSFGKLVANSADNFATERRSGGREFKSTLLHTTICHLLLHLGDSLGTRAWRAIRDRARTRRTLLPARLSANRPIPLSAPFA